jgi:hypothetical protein
MHHCQLTVCSASAQLGMGLAIWVRQVASLLPAQLQIRWALNKRQMRLSCIGFAALVSASHTRANGITKAAKPTQFTLSSSLLNNKQTSSQ